MPIPTFRVTRRRFASIGLAVIASTLLLATSTASAQDVMTKESAAVVKAAFLADLEVMRGKFIGLAQAFPARQYTWRPMDGVRSVSEVLMLIASEGYGFAPTGLGGKAGLTREEMAPLSKVTDKAQVIDHLTKGFAHAKKEIESIDPATLTGKRRVMGQDRATAGYRDGDRRRHARASRPVDCLRAHESHRAALE